MIRLQRTVQVRSFEAEATVAVGHDRPEFLAVARLAADLRRPIFGEDVCRELLAGMPSSIGWRVIERCLRLGLLERNRDSGPALLSELGAQALAHGSVLVPEERLWRIYWLEDVLVDAPLLHVQPLDAPSAKQERKELNANRRERGPRPDNGQRQSPILKEAADKQHIYTSVVNGKLFAVQQLARSGQTGPTSSLTLHLDWEVDQPLSVWLRGHLSAGEGGPPLRVDTSLGVPGVCQGLEYDELWSFMVASATGLDIEELYHWQDRASRPLLPTEHSRWDPGACRSFRADLKTPPLQLDNPKLGKFDASRLEGVELIPRTQVAAQEWAEWLLWDGLQDYMVPSTLDEASRAVEQRFPLYSLKLPSPGRLLQQARAQPAEARSRFLLAPADLGLWR